MVELKGVSHEYENGVEGLKDVNLKVTDGEFCFIAGRSGSGKSTLSKLLTGELRATSGEVRVNGYNMGALKPRSMAEARRTIGMVFQDYRLISTMTVEENLEFAMRCVGASTSEIARRLPEVLELVGLEDKMDSMPSEMSGGEQQRAAIARAIINHPLLIIADEPTGNLDPKLAVDIMKLFQRINEMGTTTIVITHARELVDTFPSRVITLSLGRVVHDAFGRYVGSEEADGK